MRLALWLFPTGTFAALNLLSRSEGARPAGDYAVYSHHGVAEDRRRTYDLLYGHWLPAQKREPANAPPIEVYTTYNGALDALDRVTSVHVPLVPRHAA